MLFSSIRWTSYHVVWYMISTSCIKHDVSNIQHHVSNMMFAGYERELYDIMAPAEEGGNCFGKWIFWTRKSYRHQPCPVWSFPCPLQGITSGGKESAIWLETLSMVTLSEDRQAPGVTSLQSENDVWQNKQSHFTSGRGAFLHVGVSMYWYPVLLLSNRITGLLLHIQFGENECS